VLVNFDGNWSLHFRRRRCFLSPLPQIIEMLHVCTTDRLSVNVLGERDRVA
jgi:hypothetical protein